MPLNYYTRLFINMDITLIVNLLMFKAHKPFHKVVKSPVTIPLSLTAASSKSNVRYFWWQMSSTTCVKIIHIYSLPIHLIPPSWWQDRFSTQLWFLSRNSPYCMLTKLFLRPTYSSFWSQLALHSKYFLSVQLTRICLWSLMRLSMKIHT